MLVCITATLSVSKSTLQEIKGFSAANTSLRTRFSLFEQLTMHLVGHADLLVTVLSQKYLATGKQKKVNRSLHLFILYYVDVYLSRLLKADKRD